MAPTLDLAICHHCQRSIDYATSPTTLYGALFCCLCLLSCTLWKINHYHCHYHYQRMSFKQFIKSSITALPLVLHSIYILLYSREKQVSGNIMFSSATPPLLHPLLCHNFVVIAISFEGFKLHSSNLTHALLIQISRTSSIIDIVVSSKMAAGAHFVKTKSCVSI